MADLEIANIRYSNTYKKVRHIKLERDVLNYWDVTAVLDGYINYKFNDTSVKVESGDVIFFPYGSIRERGKGNEPTDYISFNFTLKDDKALTLSGGVIRNAITPQIEKLMETFFEASSPYKTEMQKSILTAILYRFMSDDENSKSEHKSVIEIKNFINNHLSEPLTLDAIAESVHFHPSYCCNIFKEKTGMTIFGYINKKRIKKAQYYLKANDVGLEDIAVLCGFTNYKYFARTFKKQTGMAPTEYKKTAK